MTNDEERITSQDKQPVDILVDLFDHKSPWSKRDHAFVTVQMYGKHNPCGLWGSSQSVNRYKLNQHKYKVQITETRPRKIIVTLLDVRYDERTHKRDPNISLA